MRLILLLFLSSTSFYLSTFAQSIDFGIDIKINQNFLDNRNVANEVDDDQTWPRVSFENPYTLDLPKYSFSFIDDFTDTTYMRFTDLKMTGNFEIPLVDIITTECAWQKNSFSVSLRYFLKP